MILVWNFVGVTGQKKIANTFKHKSFSFGPILLCAGEEHFWRHFLFFKNASSISRKETATKKELHDDVITNVGGIHLCKAANFIFAHFSSFFFFLRPSALDNDDDFVTCAGCEEE